VTTSQEPLHQHSARSSADRSGSAVATTSLRDSLALQPVVMYVPAMQNAFETAGLNLADWGKCPAAGGMVVWVGDLLKPARRVRQRS
jgi:hypothetical protein